MKSFKITRWSRSLLLSISVHVCLLAVFFFSSRAVLKPSTPAPLAVRLVSPEAFLEARKQVVSLEPNKQKPKEASYLAEANSDTVYETKARETGLFRNRPPSLPTYHTSPAPEQGSGSSVVESRELAQRIVGSLHEVSRTPDRLEKPFGAQTSLRAQEDRFASFYNRTKEAVYPIWGRKLQSKMTKGLSELYRNTYTTGIEIIFRRDGQLVDVLLRSSSNVAALDEALFEAFWELKVLPLPPSGLFPEGSKVARFRTAFTFQGADFAPRFRGDGSTNPYPEGFAAGNPFSGRMDPTEISPLLGPPYFRDAPIYQTVPR